MGRKQTGFDEDTLDTIGKHFAALVDYAKEKEGLTASAIYKQIYDDDEISNKEDKISKMKKGESITAYDVMKIQAWKNISLDWLILGKGNPPPELQKAQEAQEVGSNYEWQPVSDTVRGFIYSLMGLSMTLYTYNMKIVVRGHDYMYHDVNISFSFAPLKDMSISNENEREYSPRIHQCDAVSYLIQGLRALSCPAFKLLEMPNNDKAMFNAKIEKYTEILNSIPHDITLDHYTNEREIQFIPAFQDSEEFFPHNFLPIKNDGHIFLLKDY